MRLPGKKPKQYSKLFQNPQAENTKCLGSPCQVFYLLFLRIGASAASVASSPKSQTHPPLIGVTHTVIRTVLHKSKVGH